MSGDNIIGERMLLTGNHAASYGATLAGNANGGMVIAAYPITPQTDIIKRLSDMVADGSLVNSRYIPVESEHSAMAVVIAASMAGARSFTATSSQGLLLMGELIWWAAGSRAPVVLANVNRAVGPGWSIWTDQQDSLSMRDTGCIQYYCADNQEVLDSTLISYRIAEALGLPAMVVLDAFVLSHTATAVVVPPLDVVKEFLPKFEPEHILDPRHPHIFGGLTIPELYPSFRRKIDRALASVSLLEREVEEEFEKLFGRRYRAVEVYGDIDKADVVMVTSATTSHTARTLLDGKQSGGIKPAILRVRRFRPFPAEELRELLVGKDKVCVIDRNISLGGEGIFSTEVRAALYNEEKRPLIHSFVVGLGGQDITPDTLVDIIQQTMATDQPPREPTWIGILPETAAAKAAS